MNRSFETQDCSMDERDLKEQEYFESTRWGGLDASQLGVSTLRDRLSQILLQHIRRSLPDVIRSIEARHSQCKIEIEKLGPPRDSIQKQKEYLGKISNNFSTLVRQSLGGDYLGKFFSGDERTSAPRRLRTVVQILNKEFADRMYDAGHRWEQEDGSQYSSFMAVSPLTGSAYRPPQVLTREEFLSVVQALMRQNQGPELVGDFNPRLVGVLFHQQSDNWHAIAQDHVESVLLAVNHHLTLTADHVANQETSRALQDHLIEDEMDKRRRMLLAKLEELVRPHQESHPITYSRKYAATLQSYQDQAISTHIEMAQVDSPSDTISQQELLINNSASQLLDSMEAYYEVGGYYSHPLLRVPATLK